MSRRTAWLPSSLVALAGLCAWLGAFSDHDELAVRAHAVTVVMALLVSLVAWSVARKWLGLALAVLAKVGALYAFARDDGLATLTMSYAETRGAAGYLYYFWALPPLLLTVTLLESWVLWVWASSRRLTDTWPHRRRRIVVPAVLAVVALATSWWFFRAEFYLWRLRSSPPAGYALAKVGPRALPRIYRQLDELGAEPAGSYRSDLVDVIADIRHDQVASHIRSPLIWEVQGADMRPPPDMVAALVAALEREPAATHRSHMSSAVSQLDFNTAVDVICASFTKVPADTREPLISALLPHVKHATTHFVPGYQPEHFPFRAASQDEIDQQMLRMQQRLKCAPPLLLDALESTVTSWGVGRTYWQSDAIAIVGRLALARPDTFARARRLLAKVQSGYHAELLLRHLFFPSDLEDAKDGALLARSYLAAPPDVRRAIEQWADKSERRVDAFVCEAFAAAPSAAQRSLLQLLWRRTKPNAAKPCIATKLMQIFEKSAAQPWSLWRDAVEDALVKLQPHDERIAPWARALAERLEDGRRKALLRRLAGEQPAK